VESRVVVIRTEDRREGTVRALRALGANPVRGRRTLIKPNFNTADQAPGSTHNDTLAALIRELRAMGAASLEVGERSGPPLTADVVREKGVDLLLAELEVPFIDFDRLAPADWLEYRREDLAWRKGFLYPAPVERAEAVVATCCLKTHAHGGVFSMSLKLAVGLVPRRGYEYMKELHSSSQMRRMIAEINLCYSPALILMDGVDVFTDGGPDRGTRKRAGVMVAGTDRVAVDAVGLAILKVLGSNQEIMHTPIFEQEQIARAVELGLGVSSPEEIQLTGDDDAYLEEIRKALREG